VARTVNSTANSTAVVSTPLSSLESYNAIQPFAYSLERAGQVSEVRIALGLLLPKFYKSVSLQSSYRLLSQVGSPQDVFHTSTVVKLHLQNAAPGYYVDYAQPPEVFSVFCDFQKRSVSYTCASGQQLSASCTSHYRGWINNTCAYTTVTPRCARTNSAGLVVDDSCAVDSYDRYHTRCQCLAQVFASSSSGFDGSLQFIEISRTSQYKTTVARLDVSPAPTVEPSRAPTKPPTVPAALSLADTLTGNLRNSVNAGYAFLFILFVLVTIAYAIYSNRRNAAWNSEYVQHEAFAD
jgi:hypothetical protein